ncbi:MAG: nucleotidyltransferase [Gemmatimonadota bacterium]|nr:nucleotidyltransferase [Gemmatimonadota bacterium]
MQTVFEVSNHVEELLEDLAASLQVPPSRYEAAKRSYLSLGEWLNGRTSSLNQSEPNVYVQGSFRLGTAIRPLSEREDYDIDLVCELFLNKTTLTQEQLKVLIGNEIRAYAYSHSMKAPEEGRRCWTLDYADETQFHIDILPAIPDAAHQRQLLTRRGFGAEWTDSAIAITDREDPYYRVITENWPGSNPRGYSNWFQSRMHEIFETHRRDIAAKMNASVEDVQYYQVRTPLQSVVQILKRHRDIMYSNRTDVKPISIILTTLAAHAYKQEHTISDALNGILSRMASFIENRNGVTWIANPTDPTENFADRWARFPEREAAFFEWLVQARADFDSAVMASNREMASFLLERRLGRDLIDSANQRRYGTTKVLTYNGTNRLGTVISPAHMSVPPWTRSIQGEVHIDNAIYRIRDRNPQRFYSNGPALPKSCNLTFKAITNIPIPFRVFWQVVNTGNEAVTAKCLRGGFDEENDSHRKLERTEATAYSGTHSIECFIVKYGYLVARSGQFIVNVQ